MPSSYTASLRLTKPATGELSGTWGDIVNSGITSLIETALAGYTSIAMTDANYTLSQSNGAADEARSMMLNMTGTLTANRNVVCPNVAKFYVFRNSTTGGFSLVLKTSSGTGVTVPAGKIVTVFCDAADNIFDATNYFTGTLTVNGAFTTNSTITGGTTTTSGVFSAPLGAVGTPSYTFTGDLNTGAWSPGADTLAWSTAGAERMRIDVSGNVGVGTTTTSGGKLTVAGGNGVLINGSGASGYNNLTATNDSSKTLVVGVGGSTAAGWSQNAAGIATTTNDPLLFATNNTERMRIDSSGNVGIGKTPAYKFDVSGGAHAQAYTANGTPDAFESAGALVAYYNGTGDGVLRSYANNSGTGNSTLALWTTGAERMRVDSSGNVGIGSSPLLTAGGRISLSVNGASSALLSLATGGTPRSTFYSDSGITQINVVSGSGYMSLATADTERMRITAAGVIQDAAGLELGYKDIPRTTGGLTRGQAYATAAGFTVNTGSAAGSAYSVYNDSASAFTITQGAGLTLRQGGTTNTGNRTLAARGFATIWFNSTTEAVISGAGIT